MRTWALKDTGVIHQEFEGEVVVIDLETGNYFSLPGAGGDLWRRLTTGRASLEDLAAILMARYEVASETVVTDIRVFLAELEREGLVAEGAGPDDIVVTVEQSVTARMRYVAPTVDTFRELQDLFLLDPVHEVDPAVGWPYAADPTVHGATTTVRLSSADIVSAGIDGTMVVVNRDRGIWCRLEAEAAKAWRSIEVGTTRLRGDEVARALLEGGFVETAADGGASTATIDVPSAVTIHDELHDQIRPWGDRRRPRRSAASPVAAAICERLDAWFERVARETTLSLHSMAGHRVAVEALAGSDAASLVAALPPGAGHAATGPTLSVRVWRGEPGDAAPLVANLAESLRSNWGTLCGPRGEVVDLHTETTSAIFDPGGNVLSVVDRSRNRAWAVKVDDRPYPFWEIGGPLRFILHDHFSHHGLQLVHGAAVGDDRSALLVVGRGGSGKSSTALAAASWGLRYLGDDYCLVDPSTLTVHAMYGTGKLVGEEDFGRLPAYRGRSINADSFERGGAGKGVFLVDGVFPGSLVHTRPLRAVVVPRIDQAVSSRVSVGSRSDALEAIFPSTVGQLPGAGADDAGRVERLVSGLPSYLLQVGSDPGGVAVAIREIIAKCSAPA